MQSAPIGREELVWLLGSLCQINRQPWDPARALARFPPPYSLKTLHEAAAEYGFRLGESPIATIDWAQLSFPVVGFKPSSVACEGTTQAEAGEVPASLTPVLIVRADAERLLYFEAGTQQPATVTRSELAETFAPFLFLVAREAPAEPVTEDGTAEHAEKFGFRFST